MLIHRSIFKAEHLDKPVRLEPFIIISIRPVAALIKQPSAIFFTKLLNTHMLEEFLGFVLKKKLLPQKGPTLLAVSGGVDSVVMSALFHQANLSFAMAHCNFGLRDMASDQDEAWVRALAQQYEVAFYAHAFDLSTYAQAQGLSIQMAARTLRYTWFQTLCEKHGFEKVATAHHGNDSLETVLLHLTKGTGIAGLHGILPARGRYIRPLLFSNKAEILKYAQAEGLTWREDSSNRQDNYQRNLIRNQVVPWLQKLNPGLEATFRLTLERLGQVEAVFNEQVATVCQQICHHQGTDYYVAIHAIQDKPWAPVVAWELLKSFGFKFIQISNLLAQKHPSGTMLEAASHRLYVDRGYWIVTPHTESSYQTYTIDVPTKSMTVPPHTLQCTHIPRAQYTIVAKKEVAALNRAQLKFPLVVRKWQPGDVFYPLGMQHRKKLSDFLIDNKIPVPLKAQVWVVTSSDKIVWILGHRIDDRFKITASTQQVYEMMLKTIPGQDEG
jgi:tRNA(Ile)-lysidine synthase